MCLWERQCLAGRIEEEVVRSDIFQWSVPAPLAMLWFLVPDFLVKLLPWASIKMFLIWGVPLVVACSEAICLSLVLGDLVPSNLHCALIGYLFRNPFADTRYVSGKAH